MEQKNNTGAIFKNDKKTAENQPEYRGKMMVDGKEWEISLWVRESQATGLKYFSAAIKEPYVKPTESAPVSTSQKNQDATEQDDLPF
tara:strand:- start:100 stop:360 length:261 start_codon:yes stop_codon:yes gene_type:complete